MSMVIVYLFYFKSPRFSVAGSTSLSLLFVRLLISHALVPWLESRARAAVGPDGDEVQDEEGEKEMRTKKTGVIGRGHMESFS